MSRFKKLGLGLFALLALLLVPTLVSLFPAQKASAAEARQTSETLVISGTTYRFAGIDDRSDSAIRGWLIYLPDNFQCGGTIALDNPETSGRVATRSTVATQGEGNPVIGDCRTNPDTEEVHTLVEVAAQQASDALVIDGKVYKYAGIDDRSNSAIEGWLLYLPDNFQCGDSIALDNPETEGRVATRRTFAQQDENNPILGDCRTNPESEILYPVSDISTSACTSAGGELSGTRCSFGSPAGVAPVGGVGGAGGSADATCESRTPGWGWLLCSGIDLLDGALNWLDNQIQRLLEVNQDRYTNPGLRSAWTTFRNIAYIILIPIMLVMVIGTAIGVEAFSAYTVRKALPRMAVAIIFITLSWYICTFLIGFFNTVGSGVVGLATAPFRQEMVDAGCQEGNLNLACLYSFDADFSSGQSGTTTILRGFVNSAANAGIVIGLVLFIVISFGSILAAAMGGLIVLFAREMFILALMLLAPLAILAWIFPGNDKLWKWWWSIFSKLLIMFPLIMGVVAVGRIFAWIINDAPGAGVEGTIMPIMKLVAYLLPYAFIPFAFKFAGGVFANLAGIVNNREKGLSDRWKNLRNAGAKKFHESAMDPKGRLGREGTKLGRVGAGYRRAASFGRHGSLSPFSAGKNRWKEQEMKHFEHSADKLLEEGGGRAFNDDDASELLRDTTMTKARFIQLYMAKLQADGRGRDDAERKELAERALARAELAVGAKVGSTAMAVAAQKFRVAMTNTAYEAGTEGLEKLQREVVDMQQKGLITAVDAAGWMKSNRGRGDFSANGFVPTINFASGQSSAADQLAGAFHGADPREILGGHQRSVESFAQQAQVNLSDALASGDQVIINKALADVANIYDMLSNVSPRKAEEWANDVYGMASGVERVFDVNVATGEVRPASIGPVDPSGTIRRETRTLSVRELMDEARSNATFLDRRKEYLNARDAANAAAINEAAAPPPDPAAGP